MTDDRRPDGAEELEIVVDGHTYRSADEMPPDVRGVYEQMRKALSSAVDDPNSEVETMPGGRIIRSEGTEVTLDGRHVDPADLPPKLRRAYEEALAELDHAEEFQGPGRDRTVGEAERGVHRNSVRVESRTKLGGGPRIPRQLHGPLWMNVLVLLICAALLVAIWLAY